jgi:hypothetical protein
MLISQTLEPDDVESAVREIMGQLDLGRNQLRNSVGLVHCNQAFVESGALRAICERLPFPVLGFNTFLHSSSLGLVDNMLLTATVLTSDTVKFAAGLSPPMTEDVRWPTAAMYIETENLLRGRPALGLVFGPNIYNLASGEIMTEALDEVSDGVPFFGSQPADFTTVMREPRVFFNGEAYDNRAALLLVEGDVRPRFNAVTVSPMNRIRQKAIVTASDANIVREVNGMPVLEFMDSLGLCFEGHVAGTHTIALFIDRKDGSEPMVRVVLNQTEEGWLVLSGRVPVDSTFGLGALDERQILNGVRRLSLLAKLARPEVFLMYSCLSRNFVLGFNYLAEADAARLTIEGKFPYIFGYSSGEICPVPLKDGRWRNVYHNMAIISFSM